MEQIQRAIVLFALIVVAMGSAGHHLISKIATSHGGSPLMLAAWRSLLGTAVMYSVNRCTHQSKDESQNKTLRAISDWRSFAPLGLFMAGNIVGFLSATKYLSALTCSIMQPAVPAVAAVLCMFSGIEEISVSKVVSISLSVMGAVIVLTHGEQNASLGASTTSDLMLGSFFIGMQVLCNASYWVYQKKVLKEYPPVTATATAYLFATVLIVTIAVVNGQGLDVDAWMLHGNIIVWTCMAYIILISSAFNYCVQGWANSQTSPTLVTVFMTLPPFFATLISALFLGAIISMGQLAGGLVIVSGLLLNVQSGADCEKDAEGSTESSKLVSESA